MVSGRHGSVGSRPPDCGENSGWGRSEASVRGLARRLARCPLPLNRVLIVPRIARFPARQKGSAVFLRYFRKALPPPPRASRLVSSPQIAVAGHRNAGNVASGHHPS